MGFGTPPYMPHIADHVAGIMGVVGTLGTADVSGTAPLLPVSVNPITGALYTDNIGTSGVTKIIDNLAPYVFNTINITYPSGTTEVYAYLFGTLALGTITLAYSDATKGSIISVIKTP